jgi:hypothetical protein
MEPSETQFSQKGTSIKDLEKRANTQRIEESDITRNMTPEQEYNRDVQSGVAGARNVVNLNPTLKEATENPSTLGGPVSGAALAKLKAKKSEAKRTKEKEMKRR